MQPHKFGIHLLAAGALMLGVLSAAPARAQLTIQGEAYSARPFGVGRLTIGLPTSMQPEPLGVEALCLTEKEGRALYPAIGKPLLGGLFADLIGLPHGITVWFLFRGDGPLELTLHTRAAHTFTLRPQNDPAAAARLLDDWWAKYTAPPGLLETKPDYPPLVDSYLTTTLARRLDLGLPKGEQTAEWQQEFDQHIGLMLGTESVRVAMQQARILGLTNLDQRADRPLPAMPAPPATRVPTPADEVQIEPIALRVPEECFYVHFATFGDFVWFQDTLARWGGDLQNLVATRGLDQGISGVMEQRLVMKLTDLARLLGPTVISEVAVIGTDTFFREGAAFGILFHARNSTVLAADFAGQRLARLAAGGVEEEKITIAGRTVSLLASPDGTVRSYYVVDGDYHLVTTSRPLVERFLETGSAEGTSDGEASPVGALGSSAGFRHARTVMPLEREDTAFVYLSEAFFRNFAEPRCRVEMARRLQATADISLVRLARLAAAAEDRENETIEELIAGGLLPPDFGPRPDGSRTVLEDGEVYDSLRGRYGAFLPLPETPVEGITHAEAAAYDRFADFYRERWGGQMDPALLGIKRHALPDDQEQVVIDARLSPFAQQHYELLSRYAGPPSKRQLAPVAGDVAAGEMVLKDHVLFGGLQDSQPPVDILGGSLLAIGTLRDLLVGYVGTDGALGLLSLLDVQILGRPDAGGYSSNVLGLWRREIGPFTVFSLHPEVLAHVTPQLRFQEAERPAQLRIRVDDPSGLAMTGFLNSFGYVRTRETSLGNLRLLNSLRQQLRVPPEECRAVAEVLLAAKLICPLGGEYVLQQGPDGGRWTSTALQGTSGGNGILAMNVEAPPGYEAPPMSWFRGLQLEATMDRDLLTAHAEVIMQMPPEDQ